MKKIIHVAFMIAGTAIGAGLLALPMEAVDLGVGLLGVLIVGMLFVTYQSLWMSADLNIFDQTPVSIVELSRKYGNRFSFVVTLSCFYLLFFGLLVVYFACISDTIRTFCSIDRKLAIGICGIMLFLLLNLRANFFANLSSLMVLLLMGVIFIAIVHIGCTHSDVQRATNFQPNELMNFLPILFTSFGVQGCCSYACSYLENDRKKLRRAFLIGLCIPAAVYFFWILCVLKNAYSSDLNFFQRLQTHQVSVGELILFLCESSSYQWMGVSLKILTLFAIVTSMVGVSIGVLQSLQAFLPKWVAKALLCFIPVFLNLTIADAFLKVLSFASIMLVIFAILIPYALLGKIQQKRSFRYHIGCFSGILILFCEIKRLIFG